MSASVRSSFILLACTILGVAKAAPAELSTLKTACTSWSPGRPRKMARSTTGEEHEVTISKDLVAKIEPGNGPVSGFHSAIPTNRSAPSNTRPQPPRL